jgi:UDP-N-acetylmuramate dehydrogenase
MGLCAAGGTGEDKGVKFADLLAQLPRLVPDLRGRLAVQQPLAPFTWFRVGGPAQALFAPADSDDLAYFLRLLPAEIPVTIIGLGSNLIVRDGGVPGVVIRLAGKAFGRIGVEADHCLRVGAAVPDVKIARAAAEAGIDGLAFFRGIPGSLGGALRMNAGAHGGETKDICVSVQAVDRRGQHHYLSLTDMGFAYRHCAAAEDLIFTEALLQGEAGAQASILAQMEHISGVREASQPIKEKTGGSTFKNPPGVKAWQLIDQAGCRGLVVGDAQVSPMHCNFLINRGAATARDIEVLGETVRRRVADTCGIELEWEIKRVGLTA